MNKFLKGAIAGAMVIPCVFGFTGCGDKVDKTEVAYNEVLAEVETIANKLVSLETVGTEFQLNINMSVNAQKIIAGVVSPEGSMAINLKAVLGARHTETNKEIFGDVSLVGDDDAKTNLLSAYIVDDIGQSEYTSIGTITSAQWEALKDNLYIEAEGVYVSANVAYDEIAEYYMATEDLLHVYLNSNISALEGAIGFDITEQLPMLGDGKVYGTLYTGEDLLPDDGQIGGDEDISMDMESILSELPNYETIKEQLALMDMGLSRVGSNGDVGIKIEGQGTSIQLIAKANGGLKLVCNMIMPSEDTTATSVELIVEIDAVDEIDTSYIPSDLTGYGEAMDLDAWIEELMSGM